MCVCVWVGAHAHTQKHKMYGILLIYTSDEQTTARGPDTAPEMFYPARATLFLT